MEPMPDYYDAWKCDPEWGKRRNDDENEETEEETEDEE